MKNRIISSVWLLVIGLSFFVGLGLFFDLDPNFLIMGTLLFIGYTLARKRTNRIGALILAIPFLFLGLCILPLPSIIIGKLELYKYDLIDIKPDVPIRLSGDVRIERRHFYNDPESAYPCDQQCWIVLFQPDVKSVTIGSSVGLSHSQIRDGIVRKDARARTYKITQKRGCSNKQLENYEWQGTGISYQTRNELKSEYLQRLHSGICLSSEPELSSYDFLLRYGYWQIPELGSSAPPEPTQFGYPLRNEYIGANYTEVRTKEGIVLQRSFNSYVNAYSVPFIVGNPDSRFYEGGDIVLSILRERYFEDSRDSYWNRSTDSPFFEYDHLAAGVPNKDQVIEKAELYVVDLTGAKAKFLRTPLPEELGAYGVPPMRQGRFACNRPSNTPPDKKADHNPGHVKLEDLKRCYEIEGQELIRNPDETVFDYWNRAGNLWSSQWYLRFYSTQASVQIEPDGSSWWLIKLNPSRETVGFDHIEKPLGELLLRVDHDGQICPIRKLGVKKIDRYFRNIYSACLPEKPKLAGF